MQRVAVLVDAGYFFAQGSVAIAGSGQSRKQLRLDAQKAIQAFQDHCCSRAEGCSLLRVYWYDGVGPRGPTHDHESLAGCDNLKLRLGFINSQGQQKGVDSLIVTDLIELARNKAITDAVLMAGDEDLRIGVQVAQSYGVRVHLLGITPARGSQSKQLMHEADTTAEWSRDVISKFLSVLPGLSTMVSVKTETPVQITPTVVVIPKAEPGQTPPTIEQCALDFAAALDAADMLSAESHFASFKQIPSLIDGKLLATTRDRIGRTLKSSEREQMRATFMSVMSKGG